MRAPCVDKNGIKKGAWSEEEDKKLRAYILRYGHWNWRLLPKFAGLARCGKSCRLRWVNYLKPGVKRGNYSKEEEDLITKLHDELGNKWSAIAAKLPGRTDNEIKNYWHTHLKKRSAKKATPALLSQPPLLSENSMKKSSQEAASRDVNSGSSRKPENFMQASNIPILESTFESNWSNHCRVNWDSEDSASTSPSAQEVQTSFLSEEPIECFPDRSDVERLSSSDSFDGFEESFWTKPFLVDTSYSQDDRSFSPLEEAAFFSGYPFV